jgi:hypothetical protein
MQQFFILAWRVIKVLPVVGCFFVLANAASVLRRKGYLFGTLEIVLDLLPVVCLIKAGVEAFNGDLFPAKDEQTTSALEAAA